LQDAGHGGAGAVAEGGGVGGDFAPTQQAQIMLGQRRFCQGEAGFDGVGLQEEDADGQPFWVNNVAGEALSFAGEESARQGGEHPGPVACACVGGERAPMLQVDEGLQAQLKNLMAGAAMLVGDEADAAVAAFK
jgi:hypothetical protein